MMNSTYEDSCAKIVKRFSVSLLRLFSFYTFPASILSPAIKLSFNSEKKAGVLKLLFTSKITQSLADVDFLKQSIRNKTNHFILQ